MVKAEVISSLGLLLSEGSSGGSGYNNASGWGGGSGGGSVNIFALNAIDINSLSSNSSVAGGFGQLARNVTGKGNGGNGTITIGIINSGSFEKMN